LETLIGRVAGQKRPRFRQGRFSGGTLTMVTDLLEHDETGYPHEHENEQRTLYPETFLARAGAVIKWKWHRQAPHERILPALSTITAPGGEGPAVAGRDANDNAIPLPVWILMTRACGQHFRGKPGGALRV
jgi:hypothetical protein